MNRRPVVIVLGSEGEGLRRLVSGALRHVMRPRIPMPGGFESLNVASAAAIALYARRADRYERTRHRRIGLIATGLLRLCFAWVAT